MSDAAQKKVKMIMATIILISIIAAFLLQHVRPVDFRFIETTKRDLFVLAIEHFFREKQKLPETALELEQFGDEHLKAVIHRDYSFFNRVVGQYFGWDHPVYGYGKSYDDFDKYSPKIQILGRRVLIPECQNKILYHFDKKQNNFLVMTCRGDYLTDDIDFIHDEYKKAIFAHPEKGFRIRTESTAGSLYIHKNSKKIVSHEYIYFETKAGRIAKSDLENWVNIYSD